MTEEQGTPPEVLLRVDGLSKSYGDIRAVDDITFEVRRGDVLAFLGPNGAGKTTAMKMITGFLEPDAGTVTLCGHDVHRSGVASRRSLGYLPENAPSYGEMTPLGFLGFVAETRSVDASAIDRVVSMTGLGEVVHRPIETLSKGFQRRVGLAQALIHDPEVLILDEPTDGLDPNQKAMVQELLSSIAADRCIVLSTHILDEAERIGTRALILSEGRILVDSTPAELMARASRHNAVEVTLASPVPTDLVADLRGRSWCAEASADGAVLAVRPSGDGNAVGHVLAELGGRPEIEVLDVRITEGRLDDLFREITRGVAA